MSRRAVLGGLLVGGLLLQAVLVGGATRSAERGAGSAATLQADDFEPNDEAGSAAPIEPPVRRDGLRTSSSDPDVYAVTVERGDTLTASIGFDHMDGDTDLYVYGPQERLIASSLSATDNESVSVTVRKPGTHYVLASGRTESTTNYTLAVTNRQGDLADNDDLEPNDGFESATGISPPFEREGLGLVSYDRDRFAISATGRERLTASVSHGNDSELGLRLYGPDRRQVGAGTSGQGNVTLVANLTTEGPYYLSVRSLTDGPATYSLSVETERRDATAEGTGPAATATDRTAQGTTETAESGPGFSAMALLLALGVLVGWRTGLPGSAD